MPNDLYISTAPSPTVGNDLVTAARSPAAPSAPVAQAAQSATTAADPPPNPTLQLDAALGLVVIQFHNDSGAVTSSIPSQQQIDAYRLWQEDGIGSPPNLEGGVVLPPATGSNA